MFTLDWTSKDSLMLITEYRNHPILWDKNIAGYKNKLKRIDAWTDIANKFGCSKSEVERKMGILLTQYRREKHKIMMKYYDGTDDPYCSTWYAFQEFSFLENYKAQMQQSGEMKISNFHPKYLRHASSIRHRMAKQDLSHFLHIESNPASVEAPVPPSPPPPDSVETVISEPISQQKPDVMQTEESLLQPRNSSAVSNHENRSIDSPSVEEVSDKGENHHPMTIIHSYAHNLHGRASNYPSYQQTPASIPKVLKRKKKHHELETSKQLRGLATKILKEDDCDHIGANVTLKLRSMDKSQRIIAEKLIGDVIFYGQINDLKVTARVFPEVDKPS